MNSNKVSEFGKLISNQNLINYLSSVSIETPTQIQSECIPMLLEKGHYTIQGRTGSGKTFGYLLPIIEKLKEQEIADSTDKAAQPKAIILLPTRELALQIFGIAKAMSHFARLRIRKLVGGDKGRAIENLYASKIDILITTPDRCLRAFKNNELSASSLSYFVFDEADQLLEPSFQKSVGDIASIVTNQNMQIFLVSASRPDYFSRLIAEFFPGKKFKTIGQGEENILNHKVKTYNIPLNEETKFSYVLEFIEKQKNRNGLIFVGNRARAKNVCEHIQKSGNEKIFVLHKELDKTERVTVVEEFRKGGGILVATDIFSRGIDIPHLQWVLNFDIPSDPYYYLHRCGRVGRAGRSGDVFNFITTNDGLRQTKINDTLSIQGRSDLKISFKSVEKGLVFHERKDYKKPSQVSKNSATHQSFRSERNSSSEGRHGGSRGPVRENRRPTQDVRNSDARQSFRSGRNSSIEGRNNQSARPARGNRRPTQDVNNGNTHRSFRSERNSSAEGRIDQNRRPSRDDRRPIQDIKNGDERRSLRSGRNSSAEGRNSESRRPVRSNRRPTQDVKNGDAGRPFRSMRNSSSRGRNDESRRPGRNDRSSTQDVKYSDARRSSRSERNPTDSGRKGTDDAKFAPRERRSFKR